MILKTALSLVNQQTLPNAFHLKWMESDRDVYFRCNCGNSFALRNTNSFVSWADIKCPDCKRLARLKDNIGERYVYKRVKWDAKKAGRSFDISFDWFKKVIHEPCHYCQRTDINKVSVASKIPGQYLLEDFRYNGIDRVDNAVGYEEDNCVPCCVVCNRAKNSMPYDEFMEYIRSLVNYQNSLGDEHVDKYAVQDSRIPYQGRHRKTGNDVDTKESQEDSLPVFTPRFTIGQNVYYGVDGEVWYSYSGGPYRKVERTV